MDYAHKTAFASAAYTATQTSATLSAFQYRGAQIIIDVTAIVATPSVVFTVRGFDATSGKTYDLLSSVAITGVGTTVLTVYPSVTPQANIKISDALPSKFIIHAEHGDADSITYSVGVNMLV